MTRQLSCQGAEFPLNGTEISIQPLLIWVILPISGTETVVLSHDQGEAICTLPCILLQILLPIFHLVSLLKPVGKMVRENYS